MRRSIRADTVDTIISKKFASIQRSKTVTEEGGTKALTQSLVLVDIDALDNAGDYNK